MNNEVVIVWSCYEYDVCDIMKGVTIRVILKVIPDVHPITMIMN